MAAQAPEQGCLVETDENCWRWVRELCYTLFMNVKTKTKTITSFAAPTDADLRTFDSLTADEQKTLVLAEIDKGFEGTPEPMTEQTSSDILKAASARLPSNARR